MSEVIQNKDSFLDRLKKLVERENKKIVKSSPDYEKYIEEEIAKMLKERNKFVAITTPEEEKIFKAEVKRSLTAALLAKDSDQKERTEISDNEKTEQEKKEEIAEKKKDSNMEKTGIIRDANSKDIGYLDRLELLNQMRVQTLRDQLNAGNYVPSDKEYYKMLLLQKSIESDRDEYLEGLDEKTKLEVLKIEEDYKGKELDIERKSNQKFRQELDEFKRLNIKVRELNKFIEQKQEEMQEGKVDPEEYQKTMNEKQLEMASALERISALNPEKLQEVCDIKIKHERLERGIMGAGYRAEIYNRSSDEMKKRLDYKTGKENIQATVIKAENSFFDKNGIQRTINSFKSHKEELEEELDDINNSENSPENIKRKSEILKELRIVDSRLDSAENKKDKLEQGINEDEEITATFATEDKIVEEEIKEIEKDFEEIDKNIEEMETDVQTAGIQGKSEEKIRAEAIVTGAIVSGAVSVAGGSDGEALLAGVVAAEVKEEKEKGKISEWEGMVNSTPDEEAVENFRETQEAMIEQEEQYEQERIRR